MYCHNNGVLYATIGRVDAKKKNNNYNENFFLSIEHRTGTCTQTDDII
jgi:hypothetical protein